MIKWLRILLDFACLHFLISKELWKAMVSLSWFQVALNTEVYFSFNESVLLIHYNLLNRISFHYVWRRPESDRLGSVSYFDYMIARKLLMAESALFKLVIKINRLI